MPTTTTGTLTGLQGSIQAGNWRITVIISGAVNSTGVLCGGCVSYCNAYYLYNATVIAVNTVTGANEEYSISTRRDDPHPNEPWRLGTFPRITLADGSVLDLASQGGGPYIVSTCGADSFAQALSIGTTTYAVTLTDITASDIAAGATLIAQLTGLSPTFISQNSDRIAADLTAEGVTYPQFTSFEPAAIRILQDNVPPSASSILSGHSAILALALGLPMEAINAVADQAAINLQAAYVRSKDLVSEVGLNAVIAALQTLPDVLKPLPQTATKPGGCGALGYVWSAGGRCYANQAAADAAESILGGTPPPGDEVISTAPPSDIPAVTQVIIVSAQNIASAIGSTPALVIASAGAIAARLVAMGYSAHDLQTDQRAVNETYAVASEVVGTSEFPTVPVVIGLAGAGVLALVLLRRKK